VAGCPLGVEAGDTEPQGAAEQETAHVTPLLAVSLRTVAVIVTVPPACTAAEVGETVTLMAGGGGGGGALDELPQAELTMATPRQSQSCSRRTRFVDFTTHPSVGIVTL
jgi:hypothetical protein